MDGLSDGASEGSKDVDGTRLGWSLVVGAPEGTCDSVGTCEILGEMLGVMVTTGRYLRVAPFML